MTRPNIFKVYNVASPRQMTQRGVKSFFANRLYWLRNHAIEPTTFGQLLNLTEYTALVHLLYPKLQEKEYFVEPEQQPDGDEQLKPKEAYINTPPPYV